MKELNANDLDQVSGGMEHDVMYLVECEICHRKNVTMRPGEDKIPICEDCLKKMHANGDYKTDPVI